MAVVELKLPHHAYAIHIEPGLLNELGTRMRAVVPHDRTALLADVNVAELHGPRSVASLREAGYHVVEATVPAGEDHKNLDTVERLYATLVDAKLERRSPVIAMGGGVVGDIVGFVAATYLRGVPFVQCPTTLLAMVDASVGGKVGVNLPQGKNLVGAFHQPVMVVIDTQTLTTLPARELRCGLAECVKHAVIRDAELFDWLEANLDAILALDQPTLVELVRRNVAIKAAVVMADEKESGVRAHLNFGHTFAHAIEATGGYGGNNYHHGEAVSLGMIAATRLAVEAGLCDGVVLGRLTALLDRIGLPAHARDLAPIDALLDSMRLDKKVADGRIRLVLPQGLGSVTINGSVAEALIRDAWRFIGAS
mgnify:CR=1 FL=1